MIFAGGGRGHAPLSDAVQLHAGNMDPAHQEAGGSAGCRAAVHRVGRRQIYGFWYAFGDHDGYNLWEAPDNVSMAAVAVAIGAGGALSSIQTTVLLTVEETLAALEKAQSIKYKPPGS
jgi:uncharacterized protein with GYD domain